MQVRITVPDLEVNTLHKIAVVTDGGSATSTGTFRRLSCPLAKNVAESAKYPMSFTVFPAGNTPLTLASGASSGDLVFSAGAQATSGANTFADPLKFVIRVALTSAALPSAASAAPTITLTVGTGAAVTVPSGGMTASLYRLPASGGSPATILLTAEANNVWRVDVVFYPIDPAPNPVDFTNWRIRFTNNDAAARQLVWVVGQTDAEAGQPWLHATVTDLTFDTVTNKVAPLALTVENRGTGDLTITSGPALAGGFAVAAVPPAIVPGMRGDISLTFTGPSTVQTVTQPYAITSNDTTAAMGGAHNRQVTLIGNARQLEVVILLDLSGSMATKPDGTPTGEVNASRWGHARSAATQFLTLLQSFGDGAGRFGVVRFNGVSATVMTGTNPASLNSLNINAGAITAAVNQITAPTLVPTGNTPMGEGIEACIGATNAAYGQFISEATSSVSKNLNRRYLVLLSDGASNGAINPRRFITESGLRFTDKKVKVITTAYGDTGDVDHTLLQDLATGDGDPDGYNDAGAGDAAPVINLAQSFKQALIGTLQLQPAVDPLVTLTSANREVRREVLVLPYDNRVVFLANWETANTNRVTVTLVTPLCEVITRQVAISDPQLDFASGDRFVLFTVPAAYLRNDANPTRPRTGAWTLVLSGNVNATGDREQVSYDVITESRLRLALTLAGGTFVGDAPTATARLTLDGRPVTGASVTLRVTLPGASFDTFLATTAVTPNQYVTARNTILQANPGLRATDLTVKGIKKFALAQKDIRFLPTNNTTTLTMTDTSNSGTYMAQCPTFGVTGTVTLYVVATGTTEDGVAFRREQQMQVHVETRPAPTFTIFDTIYQIPDRANPRMVSATIRAYLRDSSGNAVFATDPDWALEQLSFAVRGAEWAGDAVVYPDGSIGRTLRYDTRRAPTVTATLSKRPQTIRLIAPQQLIWADTLLDFQPGTGLKPNTPANKDLLLGDPLSRDSDVDHDGDQDRDDVILQRSGFALGGGGSVILGFEKIAGVSAEATRAFAITVLVGDNDDLRPYIVERARLPAERFVREAAELRKVIQQRGAEQAAVERAVRRLQELEKAFWEPLGESSGVTQTFTATGQAQAGRLVIRIRDTSGRALDRTGELFERPGIALRGVGVAVGR